MKIVILDGYALNPGDLSWKEFECLGDFYCYDRTEPGKTVERIGDAEIVLTNKTAITEDILESCPGIKYIGVLATGYNVVDTKAAGRRNIPVCNVPSYGTEAVAQFVFAHLLNICHRIQEHSDGVHQGKWSRSADFCYWDFPLAELAGKTMGIVGYGRIGRSTARIALAFGMDVLVHSRSRKEEKELKGVEFVSLDQLLAKSDVVSLHCPLFPATEGMINRESLAQMKDGAILINTARGALIVEEDLADALNSGKIRAAGLDVVSTEPIGEDNVLLKAKNCFITPHIAWAPLETRKRLMDIAAKNLSSFLAGNIINDVT